MTLVAVPAARAPAARIDVSRVPRTRRTNVRLGASSRLASTSASKSDDTTVTIASRVVASLGALVLLASSPAALAAQPIEWAFSSSSSGESIGDILKDSLEESGIEVRRAPKKAPVVVVEVVAEDGTVSFSSSPSAEEEPSEPSEPIDVAGTAFKFGKLGAILVAADVITFAVMGRSVLGVMDDGGEDGWKEKMADQILERRAKKDAAAKSTSDEETPPEK
jgi:hypothetical protein